MTLKGTMRLMKLLEYSNIWLVLEEMRVKIVCGHLEIKFRPSSIALGKLEVVAQGWHFGTFERSRVALLANNLSGGRHWSWI
jgi:hypothetical protein